MVKSVLLHTLIFSFYVIDMGSAQCRICGQSDKGKVPCRRCQRKCCYECQSHMREGFCPRCLICEGCGKEIHPEDDCTVCQGCTRAIHIICVRSGYCVVCYNTRYER